MADNFASFRQDLSSPATDGVAVTPSDSTVLTTTRALFVGGAGDLAVEMASGNALTFAGVTAGSILPVRVTRIKATGTTATNIVALW